MPKHLRQTVPQFRRQDSHNRQNSFDDLTDEGVEHA